MAQVQLQQFSQKAYHKIGTVAKPTRTGNVRNASPAVQVCVCVCLCLCVCVCDLSLSVQRVTSN